MPVSGNEETGFKPIAWQSSDYSAGIPIKKRRFPLIRSPSPPVEEQSSLLAKNDSQQEKLSTPSQGLPIVEAPDVAISVSGLLTTRTNTSLMEETSSSDVNDCKLAPTIENHPRVPIEKLNSTSHSTGSAEIQAKEKVAEVKTSTCVLINPVKIELKSASTEALAPTVGKETSIQNEVEEKCQSAISNVSGNINLSLSLEEHLIPAVAGPQSGESCQGHEKEELVSLNLSLSKGERSTQDKIDDLPSNNDGENTCANRSNWDLNTTMDTWESSLSDASAGDLKPLNCMDGMVGSTVNTENQNIVGVGCRSDAATLSTTSEASLLLGLSSSCLQLKSCENNHSFSAKVGPDRTGQIIHSLRLSLPSNNVNVVNCRAVKTEPVDKNVRQDSRGATANIVGQDTRVKPELVEMHNQEPFMPSKHAILRSIKLEPVNEVYQENVKKIGSTSKVTDKQMMHANNNLGICSSSMSNQSDEQILPPKDGGSISPFSKDVHASENILNHSEHLVSMSGSQDIGRRLPQEACETAIQIASELHTELNQYRSMDDAEKHSLKSMGELPFGSCVSVESSVSDEEKINLSGDMLEEESYGSDYDSDGNHNIPESMVIGQDGGEDDYEDGEVRESVSHTVAVDSALEKSRVESINEADYDNKITDFRGLTDNELTTSSLVKEKVNKAGDPGEMNDDYHERSGEFEHDKEIYQHANKNPCFQESVEIPNMGPDNKNHIAAVERKSLDVSRRKDTTKDPEMEKSSDQVINTGHGTLATASVASDGNTSIDVVERNHSPLPKAEASSSGDFAGKDANTGGTRSRIINLPRASNTSSSSAMRSILGGSVQSRTGGERLSDVAFDGEKLHPRGRDEFYVDGSRKFSRERHHDQSSRNSRMNFVPGRGRVSSRINTSCNEWENERDFGAEFYNGRREFLPTGRKFESTNADIEISNYTDIEQDGAFVGTGRGGRKLLNDDTPFLRHLNPRRRSPGGRDGPANRGLPIVCRGPRNVSPGSIGNDGSPLIGLRPNDKFMRGFPDDSTDPVFARSQPPFEGLNGHFVRGNRNFSPVQRRGIHRVRSKSPVRGRVRSPGPWPSPRRRSPDGFGGHPELSNRRSPPIYRMERMRSPDHPCFHGDMVVRRHGSSTYMSRPSNDLRDMESGRDHGHPRSVVSNRSPSGRVLLRKNRRFDMVDPRERTDNDNYFRGPISSGRFHELGGDGNVEDRRRFGERREPLRPFRPPYNGPDGDGFHLNGEDGPRSLRFCQEGDPEFHERGNLREFDRRVKNRHVDASRRMRSIEDQEGNFRHGGQVWHGDGFDGISPRVKRKRF